MSDPLVPNYKKDVGRLATDRYDFEDHIQGNKFRHKANQIDLFPTVVISGGTKTNVQDAIETLASIVSPPSIPDATTLSKGIVQLTGDISGVATNVVVSGIRGYPVTTLAPSSGQVLTWTGSAWTPAAPINVFSAGGDLIGSNVSQQVAKISGNSGSVDILASNLLFNSIVVSPTISQNDTVSGHGTNLSIKAQNSTLASHNGGNVAITGGSAGASGIAGGVSLSLDNFSSIMLDSKQLSTGNRVLGLLNGSILTTAEMPANTGDMVVYIRDAALPPTSGNPVNGSILYSVGGKLHVKEASGNDFALGSIPNPSIWGDTGQQTYTYKSLNQTTGASVQTVLTYLIPNNYSVKIDVVMVGKQISASSNESYQVNMCMGYTVNNLGTLASVGSLVTYDSRSTAGAAAWTAPTITNSGNNLVVKTGAASGSIQVNWFTVVQLTLVEGL